MKIKGTREKVLLFFLGMILPWNVGAVSPTPKGGRPAPIAITARLDKTSILVGDTLTYVIRILHDQDIDFALDNLKKNELSFSPFTVSDIAIEQGEWGEDKKTLEIALRLSTYTVGKTELTIPAFSLYYFKKEAGRRESSLAESVKIPAMKVGLRSTLTGGQARLRDVKPVANVDLNRSLGALIVGSAGMVFVVAQGIRAAWRRRATEKRKKKMPSVRAREKKARSDLDRIKGVKGEGAEDMVSFCTEASRFVRQYLGQKVGVELAGLTPEEIEEVLGRANFNQESSRQVRAMLDRCDRVCYGREGLQSARDLQPQVLETMEKLVRLH